MNKAGWIGLVKETVRRGTPFDIASDISVPDDQQEAFQMFVAESGLDEEKARAFFLYDWLPLLIQTYWVSAKKGGEFILLSNIRAQTRRSQLATDDQLRTWHRALRLQEALENADVDTIRSAGTPVEAFTPKLVEEEEAQGEIPLPPPDIPSPPGGDESTSSAANYQLPEIPEEVKSEIDAKTQSHNGPVKPARVSTAQTNSGSGVFLEGDEVLEPPWTPDDLVPRIYFDPGFAYEEKKMRDAAERAEKSKRKNFKPPTDAQLKREAEEDEKARAAIEQKRKKYRLSAREYNHDYQDVESFLQSSALFYTTELFERLLLYQTNFLPEDTSFPHDEPSFENQWQFFEQTPTLNWNAHMKSFEQKEMASHFTIHTDTLFKDAVTTRKEWFHLLQPLSADPPPANTENVQTEQERMDFWDEADVVKWDNKKRLLQPVVNRLSLDPYSASKHLEENKILSNDYFKDMRAAVEQKQAWTEQLPKRMTIWRVQRSYGLCAARFPPFEPIVTELKTFFATYTRDEEKEEKEEGQEKKKPEFLKTLVSFPSVISVTNLFDKTESEWLKSFDKTESEWLKSFSDNPISDEQIYMDLAWVPLWVYVIAAIRSVATKIRHWSVRAVIRRLWSMYGPQDQTWEEQTDYLKRSLLSHFITSLQTLEEEAKNNAVHEVVKQRVASQNTIQKEVDRIISLQEETKKEALRKIASQYVDFLLAKFRRLPPEKQEDALKGLLKTINEDATFETLSPEQMVLLRESLLNELETSTQDIRETLEMLEVHRVLKLVEASDDDALENYFVDLQTYFIGVLTNEVKEATEQYEAVKAPMSEEDEKRKRHILVPLELKIAQARAKLEDIQWRVDALGPKPSIFTFASEKTKKPDIIEPLAEAQSIEPESKEEAKPSSESQVQEQNKIVSDDALRTERVQKILDDLVGDTDIKNAAINKLKEIFTSNSTARQQALERKIQTLKHRMAIQEWMKDQKSIDPQIAEWKTRVTEEREKLHQESASIETFHYQHAEKQKRSALWLGTTPLMEERLLTFEVLMHTLLAQIATWTEQDAEDSAGLIQIRDIWYRLCNLRWLPGFPSGRRPYQTFQEQVNTHNKALIDIWKEVYEICQRLPVKYDALVTKANSKDSHLRVWVIQVFTDVLVFPLISQAERAGVSLDPEAAKWILGLDFDAIKETILKFSIADKRTVYGWKNEWRPKVTLDQYKQLMKYMAYALNPVWEKLEDPVDPTQPFDRKERRNKAGDRISPPSTIDERRDMLDKTLAKILSTPFDEADRRYPQTEMVMRDHLQRYLMFGQWQRLHLPTRRFTRSMNIPFVSHFSISAPLRNLPEQTYKEREKFCKEQKLTEEQKEAILQAVDKDRPTADDQPETVPLRQKVTEQVWNDAIAKVATLENIQAVSGKKEDFLKEAFREMVEDHPWQRLQEYFKQPLKSFLVHGVCEWQHFLETILSIINADDVKIDKDWLEADDDRFEEFALGKTNAIRALTQQEDPPTQESLKEAFEKYTVQVLLEIKKLHPRLANDQVPTFLKNWQAGQPFLYRKFIPFSRSDERFFGPLLDAPKPTNLTPDQCLNELVRAQTDLERVQLEKQSLESALTSVPVRIETTTPTSLASFLVDTLEHDALWKDATPEFLRALRKDQQELDRLKQQAQDFGQRQIQMVSKEAMRQCLLPANKSREEIERCLREVVEEGSTRDILIHLSTQMPEERKQAFLRYLTLLPTAREVQELLTRLPNIQPQSAEFKQVAQKVDQWITLGLTPLSQDVRSLGVPVETTFLPTLRQRLQELHRVFHPVTPGSVATKQFIARYLNTLSTSGVLHDWILKYRTQCGQNKDGSCTDVKLQELQEELKSRLGDVQVWAAPCVTVQSNLITRNPLPTDIVRKKDGKGTFWVDRRVCLDQLAVSLAGNKVDLRVQRILT